jgi:hypothetical protein
MKLDINENHDSNIIRIQKNLIMMDFDIEMINKIILYFNIESEDQAIDYLTKDTNGLWGHPFVEKINDNNEVINNDNNDTNTNHVIQKKNSLIRGVTTKFTEFKNRGFSNVIYDSLTNESQIGSGDSSDNVLICEICGEPESLHLKVNNINENQNEDAKEEIAENIDNNHEIDNENIIENNDVNIDNINNNNDEIDNNMCPICLGEITNPVEMETCHHRYCRECFREYLLDLIKTKKIEKISCPTKNCFDKELKEEFFNQYLTEEEYFKFRTVRSQLEILKDPKKMFCPFCDSYALIPNYENFKLDPNDSKYKKSTMTCTKGHQFCSCGIALHEGDCYRDTNDFQKFLIDENVKQCPKCGFYIKKVNGCNHMTCGNSACQFEFCWLCMQEAVPGHFQYGKCKGMQFVNTNSCIYKLKLRHPCIYKIYNLILSSFVLLILCMIPSIILILGFIVFLLENNLGHFKNIQTKFLYGLTIATILFAFNNIAHCILALLLMIIAIGLTFKILFSFIRLLNRFKSLFVQN